MLGWQFKRPDNSSLSSHSAAASSDGRAQVSGGWGRKGQCSGSKLRARLISLWPAVPSKSIPGQKLAQEALKNYIKIWLLLYLFIYLKEILRGRERFVSDNFGKAFAKHTFRAAIPSLTKTWTWPRISTAWEMLRGTTDVFRQELQALTNRSRYLSAFS